MTDNSYGLPSHTTEWTRLGRQLMTGYPELKSKRRASRGQRQLLHDMMPTRMRPSALHPCGFALAMQDPYRPNPLLGLTMAKHLGLTSQEAQQHFASAYPPLQGRDACRAELLEGRYGVSSCAQAYDCQCPRRGKGWPWASMTCHPRQTGQALQAGLQASGLRKRCSPPLTDGTFPEGFQNPTRCFPQRSMVRP